MSISKKRIRALKAMKDSNIDYTDIDELSGAFWSKVKLQLPQSKKAISLRLDKDVLDWFKHRGKGYQSLINTVLKSFVEAKKEH